MSKKKSQNVKMNFQKINLTKISTFKYQRGMKEVTVRSWKS